MFNDFAEKVRVCCPFMCARLCLFFCHLLQAASTLVDCLFWVVQVLATIGRGGAETDDRLAAILST